MKSFKEYIEESKKFSKEESKKVYDSMNLDVDFEQFHMGMNVELEHSDLTNADPVKTAKIVLAHLKEKDDYYTRLKKVEQ